MRSLFTSIAFAFAVLSPGASDGELLQGDSHSTAAVAIDHRSSHHHSRAWEARTYVEGVNNQGWIAGHWTDQEGHVHWFLVNPFMPAVSADVPSASQSQVWDVTVSQF
jgi:hypothetical protein